MFRKSTLIVAVAAAMLFVGTSCDTLVTLDKPNVAYEAVNSGATLRLTWTAITDAKSYEIKTAESTYNTVSTSFDVTYPTTSIEVRAINGNDQSDAFTLNCAVVPTGSITVYGKSDPEPTHPSGIGFNTDGTAIAVSVNNQASSVEFVMDDVVHSGEMWLMSPIAYSPEVNPWGNASQDAGAEFDAVTIAPGTGNYNTQQALAQNGNYAAWLDHNNDSAIDANDHFAKLKILSINGTVVTVKLAYQKIGGLRWLK
jgi:hypothetical protein